MKKVAVRKIDADVSLLPTRAKKHEITGLKFRPLHPRAGVNLLLRRTGNGYVKPVRVDRLHEARAVDASLGGAAEVVRGVRPVIGRCTKLRGGLRRGPGARRGDGYWLSRGTRRG